MDVNRETCSWKCPKKERPRGQGTYSLRDLRCHVLLKLYNLRGIVNTGLEQSFFFSFVGLYR